MPAGAWRLVLGRGVLHVVAVTLWFFAMARIPVAEVTAIGYLNPIVVTVGAALIFGERLAMRRIVVDLNQNRAQKLSVRIGIHTGEAVIGNIGTSMLMNYTAIGDTVNTAKRLEEACAADQILVSAATHALLNLSEIEAKAACLMTKGDRQLKGRSSSMTVFAVEECSAVAEHS